jgi:serine/threonine protein kinase
MAESKRNYALEEILGRGSFGTVYKAWDSNLGEFVAVKVETVRE